MANEIGYFESNGNDQWTEKITIFSSAGLTYVGKASDTNLYKCAMRFPNISMSQGTTVNFASLHFYVGFKGSASTNLKFQTWGIDVDNIGTFSTTPLGEAKTTAFDSADNPMPGVGSYKQITVTSIVNEIFARSGWVSGNALGFIMEDNGSATDVYIGEEASPGLSFLTIRTNAEPNFTPTPIGISPSPLPPARNMGIKISYPDRNVLVAEENDTYFISRRKRQFKVFKEGKFTSTGAGDFTVAHGLGYIPGTSVYCKSTSVFGNFWVKLPVSFDDAVPNYFVDKYNITFHATTANEEFYYRIFLDKLVP